MNLMQSTLSRLGIAAVIAHGLVVVPHSIAHSVLHIDTSLWQTVYIVLVILVAPIVAAVYLWKRRDAGFLLLILSMAGSFVFGVYYHFIAAGTDNVASLPTHPWTNTFQISALLLAVIEFVGVIVGALGVMSEEQVIAD